MLPTSKTPKKTKFEDLTVLLYGRTKIGKSTFCSNLPGAIFLATEAGLNHVDVFQVQIGKWEDLLDAGKEIAAGKHEFRTVVIDTIDNAFNACCDFVRRENHVIHEADLEFGKGWALVAQEFSRVLTKLSQTSYGLWMISHAQASVEKINGEKINKTIPTLPEKARRTVLGMADLVLFADLDEKPDGKLIRVMRTKPSLLHEAGDRTGLLPDVLPLSYSALAKAFGGEG